MLKLQARQRLLAWKPNNVPKSGGEVMLRRHGNLRRAWSEAVDTGKVHQTPVDGGTIDRFEMRMATLFMLVLGGTPMGYLNVDVFDNVTASWVAPAVQGKGYAKKLYGEAIKFKGVLKSDSSLSGWASILWRSLSKDFDVRYKWDKNYEVEIVRWVTGVGGYVYPVLREADGTERSLEELYDSPEEKIREGALYGTYIARPK